MFKLICNKNDCANKDVFYYVPKPSNPSMCGGCKDVIIPIKMSQKEYDLIFDYDPFAKIEIGGI